MKKMTKILTILLAFMMLGSVALAQDYDGDADAPRRMRRRGGFFANKMLSIGLVGAVHLDSKTYDADGDVISTVDGTGEKFFGFAGRIYPLMNGKLGFGINMIMLDYVKFYGGFDEYEATKWLVDFDFLYRIKLGRSLVVNGGAGWSQYLYTLKNLDTGESASEWGKLGYNLTVGAEYFVTENISITGDWKWIYFTYDVNGAENSVRHFTFQLGVHYWF